MSCDAHLAQHWSHDNWSPATPPITAGDLATLTQNSPAVVIHFWAVWNRTDRLMDESIRSIRAAHQEIQFVSCDVDQAANAELCSRLGVANVPTLHCFVSGRQRQPIVGYLTPEELTCELQLRLNSEDRPHKWWQLWR